MRSVTLTERSPTKREVLKEASEEEECVTCTRVTGMPSVPVYVRLVGDQRAYTMQLDDTWLDPSSDQMPSGVCAREQVFSQSLQLGRARGER